MLPPRIVCTRGRYSQENVRSDELRVVTGNDFHRLMAFHSGGPEALASLPPAVAGALRHGIRARVVFEAPASPAPAAAAPADAGEAAAAARPAAAAAAGDAAAAADNRSTAADAAKHAAGTVAACNTGAGEPAAGAPSPAKPQSPPQRMASLGSDPTAGDAALAARLAAGGSEDAQLDSDAALAAKLQFGGSDDAAVANDAAFAAALAAELAADDMARVSADEAYARQLQLQEQGANGGGSGGAAAIPSAPAAAVAPAAAGRRPTRGAALKRNDDYAYGSDDGAAVASVLSDDDYKDPDWGGAAAGRGARGARAGGRLVRARGAAEAGGLAATPKAAAAAGRGARKRGAAEPRLNRPLRGAACALVSYLLISVQCHAGFKPDIRGLTCSRAQRFALQGQITAQRSRAKYEALLRF